MTNTTILFFVAGWVLAFLLVAYGLPLVLQALLSPFLGWIAARSFKVWEADSDG